MNPPAAPTCLVLLPGLMCDRAVWEPVMTRLGRAGHAATVAEYASCDSLEAMAQTVLRQHPGMLDVAGHSMGGRVAMELMRLAPQRVGRVALLGTGFSPLASGSAGQLERDKRQALMDIAEQRGVGAMGQEWVKGMIPAARLGDRELIDAIVQMFQRRSVSDFRAQVRALLDRPDATPVLSAWPRPAWVVGGELDAWAPAEQQRALHRLLPSGTLRLLPGLGHMFPMEDPAVLAAVLQEWLSQPLNGAPDSH